MNAGLYVHVPFCLTRCGYCDFNAYAGLDHLAGRYVRALEAEADLWASDWSDATFASAFFGGGTPTTLPADELVKLLDHLTARLSFIEAAEITVEANPDTVDATYFRALLSGGVNRVSMGAQSFDPQVLRALERVHAPDSVRRAYGAARDGGFDNLNLDLIYGANGETDASWRATLEETIQLGPEHVSAYALTIEPATPLGRAVAAGLQPAPDADVQADRYELACELLGAAGYEHYEISNWAKPGRRCVHNDGYWEARPYLGLGAGAHAYRDGVRWWNVRPPQEYLSRVEAGERPVGGEERLTETERLTERLLLGLRRIDGVPVEWVDAARVEDFVGEGLAERRNGHVALTERGMLLANEAVLELAPAG
jgi:oxygen-independent coproporphyrinogen-3 oxidase